MSDPRTAGGRTRSARRLLLIGAALAACFFILGGWIASGGADGLDAAVTPLIQGRGGAPALWLSLVGAALGSGAVVWAALIGGTALAIHRRDRPMLLFLWLVLFGGRLLIGPLKTLYGRARPDAAGWDVAVFGTAIPFPSSASYPSGHALTAVTLCGAAAILLPRYFPDLARRPIHLALLGTALLIGISRIHLGVHYPTDVLGGYLAGGAWLLLSLVALSNLPPHAGAPR